MLKTTQQQRAIVGPLKQDGPKDPKTEHIIKAAGLTELAGCLSGFQPKEREAERKTLDAIGELVDGAGRDEKLLAGVAVVKRMDFWLGYFGNKDDIVKKNRGGNNIGTENEVKSKDAEDMALEYIRLLQCFGPFARSILKKATTSLNGRICTAACDALGGTDWQMIYNHSDAILHPHESSV